MKVRIINSISGTCDGQRLIAGEVVTVSLPLGRDLLRNGDAELVTVRAPTVETAEAAPAPETTAKRTGKPRPRRAR